MGGIYASPNRQKDSKLAHYPPYLAISCGNPSMPPHIQVDDIFPSVLTRGDMILGRMFEGSKAVDPFSCLVWNIV